MLAQRTVSWSVAVALCAPTVAFAQPTGPGAPAAGAPAVPLSKRTIAILQPTSAGVEDTSPEAKQFTTELERNVTLMPGASLISAAQVNDAIKKSKKTVLRNCDGDLPCLVEVGKLVGASIVISGELGGLGTSKVVYLSAIDVSAGKELMTTNAALGTQATGGGARGALIRLLEPDRYVGQLKITVDIQGATAYVDGKRVGVSPMQNATLTVGTHALRVTHPEYRDFVRFVDVDFGAANEIKVDLSQYPVVQNAVVQNAKIQNQGVVIYHDPPWYKRWYTIAGGAGVLIVGAAALVYVANQQDADATRTTK